MEENRVTALLIKEAIFKIYAPGYAPNRPIGILSTMDKSIERMGADSLSYSHF